MAKFFFVVQAAEKRDQFISSARLISNVVVGTVVTVLVRQPGREHLFRRSQRFTLLSRSFEAKVRVEDRFGRHVYRSLIFDVQTLHFVVVQLCRMVVDILLEEIVDKLLHADRIRTEFRRVISLNFTLIIDFDGQNQTLGIAMLILHL